MNTSERWSSASSDSEISLCFFPDLKHEGLRASDVLEVLRSGVAVLSGGRDRNGGPIIIFPKPTETVAHRVPNGDGLKKLLSYLSSIPSDGELKHGFTIILDMRGCTWSSVKPCLKALEDCFPAKISSILIIKPEGFWERHRASIGSSKLALETQLTSLEGLSKLVEPSQLPSSLGGTYHYDHTYWVNMRLALEKFLFESMSLLSKLEEIQDGLLEDDFADDLHALRDQIKRNNHVKKWIIKAPIEILEEEGDRILKLSKESSHSCTGNDGIADDIKASTEQIQNILENLRTKRQKLRELWQIRKARLDQGYQYLVFQSDAENMLSWIHENRREFSLNYTEIGHDTTTAEELKEEQRNFESSSQNVCVNVNRILQVAERLCESGHYEAKRIESLAELLDQEWKKFDMDINQRSTLLACSVSFFKLSEQFLNRVKEWQEYVENEQYLSTSNPAEIEQMLSTHIKLRQEIEEAYSAVMKESKFLLAALQKPAQPTDEHSLERTAEFSDSSSHIMDIYLNVHDQHRQLGVLWEKQRSRLRQHLHICTFENDSEQVIQWIEDHGETFLKKHTGVGKSLAKAEALLKKHEEFESIAQNTFTNAEKLLEAARHLEKSGECDPQEIKQRAEYFGRRVRDFIARVTKRKELLKMAVSFYSKHQKLSDVVQKLKSQLERDETSEDPDIISATLTRLRQQCETALEAIHTAINEGEAINEDLKHQNEKTKIDCTSVPHVQKLVDELDIFRQTIDQCWCKGRQERELWLHLREFERDAKQLKQRFDGSIDVFHKGELATDLPRSKLMICSHLDECRELESLSLTTFCKGEELLDLLKQLDVDFSVKDSDQKDVEVNFHIKTVLEQLHQKRKEVNELSKLRELHLEQCVELRKLESDAKQLLGWVRNGEAMLYACSEPGSSLVEAEALMRELEEFQRAIEKTCSSVNEVRTRADKMIEEGHYDPNAILNCADTVNKRWEQLMEKANTRRAIVMASYNFFKSTEQVNTMLEKLKKDYHLEEDPCCHCKAEETIERQVGVQNLLSQHHEDKENIMNGCDEIRKNAETFLKLVGNSESQVMEGSAERLESQVRDILDQLRGQEQVVLEMWNMRKSILDDCHQTVEIELGAKEALEWIHDNGEFYLSTHTESGSSEDEAKQLLKEHEEFQEVTEEIREKVKLLLQQAEGQVVRSFFHADDIKQWATAVEKRYRDFSLRMNKYKAKLEDKLGFSVSMPEDDAEWPSLSCLQSQTQTHQAFALRETSKDSGIHEMTEEKRKSAKRKEFIMNELLQTERTYVADLKCVIEDYMYEMIKNPTEVPVSLQGCHQIIFGNIEEIYEFHNTIFLQALEKYETNIEEVGNCFVDWAERFQIYVSYCKNKPLSNSLLIEHGGNYFSNLQARYGHGLSMAAYLIKPVQRITKYQLLLKDLLSCCEVAENILEAGLEVMLNVPRRANDAMYVEMLEGVEDCLDSLGRILLQDSFTVWDPKFLRRKGKERHLFLFEQALLFTKECKDSDGQFRYLVKFKLKTSEIGITEHIAEDSCKFAIWTGLPPHSEDKRIIKACSLEVKQVWVKELREIIQQFQFGLLRVKDANSTKTAEEKAADRESGVVDDDRVSLEFDDGGKVCDPSELYKVVEDYQSCEYDEIPLKKNQIVEVVYKPQGTQRWRIRPVIGDSTTESWAPACILRRAEDTVTRRKRNSDSSTSEDSLSVSSSESPTTSWYSGAPTPVTSANGSPPSVRRRHKSASFSGSLRKRSWSRNSFKKIMNKPSQPPPPPPPQPQPQSQSAELKPLTPINRKMSASGGGSKKLQKQSIPELDHSKSAPVSTSCSTEELEAKLQSVMSEPMDIAQEHSVEENEIPRSESAEDFDVDEDMDEDLLDNDLDDGSTENLQDSLNQSTMREDLEAIALKKRTFVLREMIQTEVDYVKDLGDIVDGFIPELSKEEVPEELQSKERVIFGNIRQIHDWHKSTFVKELEKCEDAPEKLGSVFVKAERRLQMYVIYCQNKPKSEHLVQEFKDTYFNDVRTQLGFRLSITDYLIKPVQRIMKYQLLLKDFVKYTERGGLDTTELKKALEVMKVVPKRANDMMNVGMLEGFSGKIAAQGKLLLQDTVQWIDVKAKSKPKDRQVFMFEQLLIFSEPFERKTDWTVYIYRNSIKTNSMGITESVDEDPCKFAVWTDSGTAGTSEIYFLVASSAEVKETWISEIKKLLDSQQDFAKALERPIEHLQKLQQGGLEERSLPTKPPMPVSTKGQVTPSSFTLPLNSSEIHSTRHLSITPLDNSRKMGASAKTKSAPNTPTNNSSPLGTLQSIVKHMHLVSLDTAKSLEDLTSPFSAMSREREKQCTVMENYKPKGKDDLSVKKGEVVYVISSKKHDKSLVYVRRAVNDDMGWLPLKVLEVEEALCDNPVVQTSHEIQPGHVSPRTKTKRSHSFSAMNPGLRRRLSTKKSPDDYPENISNHLQESIDRYKQEEDDMHSDSEIEERRRTPGVTGSSCSLPAALPSHLLNNRSRTTSAAPVFSTVLRDLRTKEREPVKLTCKVISSSLPTIQWSKDNVRIEKSEKYRMSYRAGICMLEIPVPEVQDTGTYSCSATNSNGSESCSAKLTVIGVPDPPSKPTIREMTPCSVLLMWDAPACDGNCSITAYTVECKETGVSVWQAAVPFVAATSTVVDDLTPGATYQYRVSANNEVGISKCSPPSDFVTMEIETAPETDFDENSNYHEDKARVKWRDCVDECHNIYAELGRGRFSVVKKCVEKRTGKEFAAKFIKKRLLSPEEVEHEISILQELRHPNLNALHDTFDTLKNYVLILELLSGGRLFDYIVVMDNLTEKVVIGFLRQVLEAMQHLHDCGFAHLDIKPENILLDGGPIPKAKLVDFGDTVYVKDKITIHDLRGTPEFSAPELILSEPVDTMADMWSIGVVTYVVLCGVSPFYSQSLETMCANIINNNYEMSEDCFSDISPQAQEFIKYLLAKEKSDRLDCQGCLNSTWMKSVEARSPSPAKANKLNTSRLAAFNARRRYQHEITSISRVIQNMQNGESDV